MIIAAHEKLSWDVQMAGSCKKVKLCVLLTIICIDPTFHRKKLFTLVWHLQKTMTNMSAWRTDAMIVTAVPSSRKEVAAMVTRSSGEANA